MLQAVVIAFQRVLCRVEHAERYLVRRAARMPFDMRGTRYLVFPLTHSYQPDRLALPVVGALEIGYNLSRRHHLDGPARKGIKERFAVAFRQQATIGENKHARIIGLPDKSTSSLFRLKDGGG